jgi:zinc protease
MARFIALFGTRLETPGGDTLAVVQKLQKRSQGEAGLQVTMKNLSLCNSGTANTRLRALLLLAAILLGLAPAVALDNPPQAPPPKPLVLPTPQVRQLSNGLRVVVIERHSFPLLTLRLVVKSGGEADPAGLAGTAQFVAGLLSQGTGRRSAREIAEAIDQVGGSVESGAEWDDSYVSLTVLSEHAPLGFDLLADMVLHPSFRPAEIERWRTQTLSALSILRNDPVYVADTVFNHVIFAGTPYGHPLDGTEETVPRLTQPDLQDFHRRYYRPDNSILAVVGDLPAEEAFQRAQSAFDSWKSPPDSLPPPAVLPAPRRERHVVVIDKPDAVQTEIRVGNLAIARASPDYYALTVADQILGGPAANRLFKALRTQQGLTYGASSELVCQQILGAWVAKTNTRNSETGKSLDLVLEEEQRLRESITSPELRTAKSYLVGHMALEFESSNDIASQMLELIVHDLPLDYWNRFPERVETLSSEDVIEATRRYLDPERNVIVLVGNTRNFRKGLKKLGAHDVIPLRDLDLASPNLRRTAPAAAR